MSELGCFFNSNYWSSRSNVLGYFVLGYYFLPKMIELPKLLEHNVKMIYLASP